MAKKGRGAIGLAALALAFGVTAAAQEFTLVERVEVAGNTFVRGETLLYYVSTKAGERYDERRLREDFRRLWTTGLLDDVKLEVSDGDKGKRVLFRVTERPRMRSIEFRGSRVFKPDKLKSELAKRDLALETYALCDTARIGRVEDAIRDMLSRKRRPFNTVQHEIKPLESGGVAVRFDIDDGPETRIEAIAFNGNRVFSDAQLRGALHAKESGFFSWLRHSDAYSQTGWSGAADDPGGDSARLLAFYRSHGYVHASIGTPVVTTSDEKAGDEWKRHMRMQIPVVEGEQYRVGTLAFQGLVHVSDDEARPLFDLHAGGVYDESKVDKARDALKRLYGRRGYMQATTTLRKNERPGSRLLDLVLAVEEDRIFWVGRITFTGNHTTREKVIRREVFLSEGDVFDTQALAESIRRIDRLGYFKPIQEAPELQPNRRSPDAVDLVIKVQEENPTRFNFGGGQSSAEGTFLNGSFATANLLGLGETFQINAQDGTLSRAYEATLTKPYTFDLSLTTGLNLFARRQTYKNESTQGIQGYVDERTGGSLLAGLPAGKWSRASFSYSFQRIDILPRDAAETAGAIVSNVSVVDYGRQHESSLTPSLVRNTLDHPIAPHRGTRITASVPLAGGPLGGSLDFARPRLEAVGYLPVSGRSELGLRAEAGFVLPYGANADIDPVTKRNKLPFYERFFLGGETQLRGYDYRSVGPRDANNQAIGGTKYLLFNAEYSFDPVRPVSLLAFYDAGQAYGEGEPLGLRRLQMSTGVELRVTIPILSLPLRFIYAWNINKESFQPARAFKFAIGTTF